MELLCKLARQSHTCSSSSKRTEAIHFIVCRGGKSDLSRGVNQVYWEHASSQLGGACIESIGSMHLAVATDHARIEIRLRLITRHLGNIRPYC